MHVTRRAYHGLLKFPCGSGWATIGKDTNFMIPSNDIFHDPFSLRKKLDSEGYLYFKNMIPTLHLARASYQVESYLRSSGIIEEEENKQNGATCNDENEKSKHVDVHACVMNITCGSKVTSIVRQVFGANVESFNYKSLDVSPKGEKHGFHMDSVFMSQGTKLFLSAWIPLTDITLSQGPIVLIHGSNSHENTKDIRSSYGAYDAYSNAVEEKGVFSYDPEEMKSFGSGLVTSSLSAGDIILFGAYTFHSFLTNTSPRVRMAVESKWYLEEDEIGPDPRYAGHDIHRKKEQHAESISLEKAKRELWKSRKE